jgi:hypothetical protein
MSIAVTYSLNITKIPSHILWDFLLFYSVTCNFVPIFLSVFLLVSIRIVLFDPYLKGFLLWSYCWLLNPLNLHLVYVSVHLDIQYENTYQLENYRRLVDILMCLVMRDPEHQTKHNYQSNERNSQNGTEVNIHGCSKTLQIETIHIHVHVWRNNKF